MAFWKVTWNEVDDEAPRYHPRTTQRSANYEARTQEEAIEKWEKDNRVTKEPDGTYVSGNVEYIIIDVKQLS